MECYLVKVQDSISPWDSWWSVILLKYKIASHPGILGGVLKNTSHPGIHSWWIVSPWDPRVYCLILVFAAFLDNSDCLLYLVPLVLPYFRTLLSLLFYPLAAVSSPLVLPY